MTEEKLEKAKQLLAFINELKNQRSRWENSESIHELQLNNTANQARCVDTKWVNFEEIRLLAMARITKRLEELQQEFDNL